MHLACTLLSLALAAAVLWGLRQTVRLRRLQAHVRRASETIRRDLVSNSRLPAQTQPMPQLTHEEICPRGNWGAEASC